MTSIAQALWCVKIAFVVPTTKDLVSFDIRTSICWSGMYGWKKEPSPKTCKGKPILESRSLVCFSESERVSDTSVGTPGEGTKSNVGDPTSSNRLVSSGTSETRAYWYVDSLSTFGPKKRIYDALCVSTIFTVFIEQVPPPSSPV